VSYGLIIISAHHIRLILRLRHVVPDQEEHEQKTSCSEDQPQ
jgi:hypothetical protein